MSELDHVAAEAEYSALRGMIEDPTLLHGTTLTVDHFTAVPRRIVYTAMRALAEKHLRVDPVTILDRVPRDVEPECRLVIVDALGGPGVASNFEAYEAILVRSFQNRRVVEIARNLEKAPEKLDESLAQLTRLGVSSRWEHDTSSSLSLAHELLDRFQAGKAGIPTGFSELDRLIDGMVPGRLLVVGGRPGMGKTAVALQLALNSSEPVGFISSEMPTDQLTLRALCVLSGISFDVAKKHMTTDQWDKWHAASADFRERPLYINDRPLITPDEIARQARKWVYNNGIKVLIVDHLQRIEGDPRADRTQKIRDAVTGCREIARVMDINVIALSQVKRDIEYRQDKRPLMADFDGASTIEAEANAAIALFRPWRYDKTQSPSAAEFIVVKNRDGMEGTVHAKFNPGTTGFTPDEKAAGLPF